MSEDRAGRTREEVLREGKPPAAAATSGEEPGTGAEGAITRRGALKVIAGTAALGAAAPDATGALRVQTELDALADLGYIWRPPAARDWTPGIPSLMGYVRAATGPPPPS